MNMKLKKLLNDIQKTEDKIAELQEAAEYIETADGRYRDR